MIENSRYKIAYSSLCPAPGFLSSKNTPRYKKIADEMLRQEKQHIITERIKNWRSNRFRKKHKRMNSMPKGYDTHRSKHSHRVSMSQSKTNAVCDEKPQPEGAEHVQFIQPDLETQELQSERGNGHSIAKERTDDADVPQIK
jgi:hypothetical protein